MHPILFRLPVPNWNVPGIGYLHETFVQGSVPFYSYGIMLGLSLIVGWFLTLWLAEKDGLPKETMSTCYVVTATAALVGARLLYVLTNFEEFHSVGDLFAFRRGGFVAYGGFLGGYLGSYIYLKLAKIPLMPWADVAVPSLASGLFITRIGCYLFGCDFGRPLEEGAPAFLKKLGTFPHWEAGLVDHGDGSPAWIQHVNSGLIDSRAAESLPVHPTQLYESLFGLALLAMLMLQRKNQRFRGQVFMLFAFAYGFGRFLIEIVRDDAERGLYGPSAGAHIMIPVFLAAFSIAYSVGFANSIQNVVTRRFTQVLSIVPALVAYLAMRPAQYANAVEIKLSTSQWVAVLTSVAVAAAYYIFIKAAQSHPAEAMALNLKAFYEQEAKREAQNAGNADSSEEEPIDEPAKPAKKKAKKSAEKKSEKKRDNSGNNSDEDSNENDDDNGNEKDNNENDSNENDDAARGMDDDNVASEDNSERDQNADDDGDDNADDNADDAERSEQPSDDKD